MREALCFQFLVDGATPDQKCGRLVSEPFFIFRDPCPSIPRVSDPLAYQGYYSLFVFENCLNIKLIKILHIKHVMDESDQVVAYSPE